MTKIQPDGSSANILASWARGWNWFWFHPADPTPLGLIRFCCGLITLYVHFAYTFDLQELLGPNAWVDAATMYEYRTEWPYQARTLDWSELDGPAPPLATPRTESQEKYYQRFNIDPRQVAAKGYVAWSIWYHVTDPTAMGFVHATVLVILFLFTIGFCTRVTSVLAWLCAVSYMHRAISSLFGMDTMMNILLLYLMIAPGGAALSVDRLISRYWQRSRARKARQPIPPLQPPAPRVSANLALRLIQVNLCMIYLMSGFSKLLGGAWWAGTAVWGTLANPEFSPVYFVPFYNFLVYLCYHRWLWEVVMTAGVAFTLFVEIGFPFMVWTRKLRLIMVACAALLHAQIAILMGLNTFSLCMMTMLLAFVPEGVVHKLIRIVERLGNAFSASEQALPSAAYSGRKRDGARLPQ